MKIETSSIVTRSPEEAFDFLVNLENEPRWNPWAIKAVKLSEGPVHEGTVFRATYKRLARSSNSLRSAGLEATSARLNV